MAKTVKDVLTEKIEILDQLDKTARRKGFNYRMLLPIPIVLAVATTSFFVVRRLLKQK
jgi:hypothetical protein